MKIILLSALMCFGFLSYSQSTIYKTDQWTDLKTNKITKDSVQIVQKNGYFIVKLGEKSFEYEIMDKEEEGSDRSRQTEVEVDYHVIIEHKIYKLLHKMKLANDGNPETSFELVGEWKVEKITLNNIFIKYK